MPPCPPAPCPGGVCAGCAFIPARMVMVRAEHPSRLALDHCSGSGALWCRCPRGTQGQALPGASGTQSGAALSTASPSVTRACSKIRLHGGTEEAPSSPRAPEQAPGPVGAAPGPPGAGGRWVLGLLSGPRDSSVTLQLLLSKKNTFCLPSTSLPVVFQALP